jgi:single-strand DNA-binding protein
MSSVNKVILLGRLGRDPETRYMPDGAAITNFSMATSETRKDKSGVKQEKTEWHRIVTFARLAEIAGEFLKKGSQVYIEGRLQTNKWTDKDGAEKSTVEVIADKLTLMGSRQGLGGDGGEGAEGGASRASSGSDAPRSSSSAPKPAAAAKGGAAKFDDFEDDIPF